MSGAPTIIIATQLFFLKGLIHFHLVHSYFFCLFIQSEEKNKEQAEHWAVFGGLGGSINYISQFKAFLSPGLGGVLRTSPNLILCFWAFFTSHRLNSLSSQIWTLLLRLSLSYTINRQLRTGVSSGILKTYSFLCPPPDVPPAGEHDKTRRTAKTRPLTHNSNSAEKLVSSKL